MKASTKITKSTKFNVYGSNGRVIAVFKVKALKTAKGVKSDKVVEVENISGWGVGSENSFNASINLTQKTIRVYGFVEKSSSTKGILADGTLGYIRENYQFDFDKTFQIGDTAEYDSYNLRYLAPICNITKSYVEFAPKGYSRKFRLKLGVFIGRNYNLDLDKIQKQNHETSMYI